jgi:hypothetical protein
VPDPGSAFSERRRLLLYSAATLALESIALGCSKSPPATCTSSSLSADDLKVRTTLAYVDKTPDPGKPCVKCLQYIPAPAADQCGACKVMKGPVHPSGYCNAFAPL